MWQEGEEFICGRWSLVGAPIVRRIGRLAIVKGELQLMLRDGIYWVSTFNTCHPHRLPKAEAQIVFYQTRFTASEIYFNCDSGGYSQNL
jgi:hypothetical protein